MENIWEHIEKAQKEVKEFNTVVKAVEEVKAENSPSDNLPGEDDFGSCCTAPVINKRLLCGYKKKVFEIEMKNPFKR